MESGEWRQFPSLELLIMLTFISELVIFCWDCADRKWKNIYNAWGSW